MQLIDPSDTIERQNAKLIKITEALMRRVEQKTEQSGLAYAQFERAALLEAQVRQRTQDLERTLDLLHDSNAQLAVANRETEAARSNLAEAIETVDEGFALFDAQDLLVMSNSRFCKDLSDIKASIQPGLAFKSYVDLIGSSRFLSLPAVENRATWTQKRMQRHTDNHVVFNVSLVWDRWLQVSEHRTASGGTVILQTDVTGIMRLERRERAKLMDRQAKMVRATLDHINQGVCIFGHDGRLVGWNMQMETLLNLPIDENVVGLEFAALVDRLGDQFDYSGTVSRAGLLAWAEKRTGRRPLTFEVDHGKDRVLSVFAQEMPDRGFVISFTDVTAEREAARALREMNETLERRVEERTLELGDALAEARRANASKTRFVAAASHDLLQPLSAAKLFVSSLEDRATDDLSREVAGKAVSALASVEGIIEALLDISKLDSGQASMNIQPVRLGSILTSLRDELTPSAGFRGLDLHIVDSSVVVRSDAVFLRRILQNLVSNALRYTAHGKVLVGVRRTDNGARIEVHDTGPGIALADQRTVFQEFKQLSPNRSGANGLGLGLAIVERACQSLGHPLALRSEPGQGCCFSVTVDCVQADVHDVIDTSPDTRLARPKAEGVMVLLVENDAEVARAITLMIEDWGSHVVHASSGEEALDLLDEIEIVPDGFLLDYQLGDGMQGTDLLARLRTRYGKVPARIISADRTPDLLKACIDLKVKLIPKPLNPARISRFLDAAAT